MKLIRTIISEEFHLEIYEDASIVILQHNNEISLSRQEAVELRKLLDSMIIMEFNDGASYSYDFDGLPQSELWYEQIMQKYDCTFEKAREITAGIMGISIDQLDDMPNKFKT